MAYMPYAPETAARYVLTSADGVTAVFNDPSDPNYVGMLSNITGLGTPEIRESAEELVEADGGQHGNFYFNRRSIVMDVAFFNHASPAARRERIDRAKRAATALRADSTLSWKPTDWETAPYIEMYVPVRLQQRFDPTGGWTKEGQIALVSQYSTLFSTTQYTASTDPLVSNTTAALENHGSYAAFPVIRITGISANPTVTSSRGEVFRTTGLNLAAGEIVEFDMLNHTGYFVNNAGSRINQSANRYINWATTAWPFFPTGTTTLTIGGGGTLQVYWRDVWV